MPPKKKRPGRKGNGGGGGGGGIGGGPALLDENTRQLLIKTLRQKERQRSGSSSEEEDEEEILVDPTDVGSIIKSLVTCFHMLSEEIRSLKAQGGGAQSRMGENPLLEEGEGRMSERIRTLEDELDNNKQRDLKGNLVISSKANKYNQSVIKSEQELCIPLVDHVRNLLEEKYGVDVPEDNIQACHRLPNGSIILRIWKRTENSAWSSLTSAIRTGGKKAMHFYANFHLTHRRSGLLYALRQYKKEGKIFKFFSNENGALAFKRTESSAKTFITFFRNDKSGKTEKTLTTCELAEMFQS